MEEEEHEVYGGEIPDEGEMEGDMESHNADVDMSTADDDAVKELDEMKKRLKEMEEEAAALREMQAKVEKEMGAVQDPASVDATQASREETDARSVERHSLREAGMKEKIKILQYHHVRGQDFVFRRAEASHDLSCRAWLLLAVVVIGASECLVI